MERSVDIMSELNEISPLVAGSGRANMFIVPEGYFETLADSLLFTVKNDVPQGYFDSLSNNILSKIEGTAAHELHELSPFMAGLKKTTPYEVPANYFETVPAEMVIATAEENTVPVLQGINKKQPFEVPAGYFDQLPNSILDNVKAQSSAKVIAIPAKRSNSFWKYAAAAVFTGFIAFGVYQYSGTSGNEGKVAAAMDDKKFNETIENLAEEDIIKYLEKNGSDADVAALALGIDEGSLPDQEEYFTDESALDKFLEDIDSKN